MADFFEADKARLDKGTSEQRKADQAAVDAAVDATVAQVPQLAAYLKAKWSLSKADRPHLMKF